MKAYLLGDASRAPLDATAAQGNVVVKVPAQAPDPIDTVVVLETEGEPSAE